MCVLLRLIASQIVPHRKNSLFRPGSARQGQVLTYPPKNARRMTGCDRGCNGNPTLAIAAVPPPRGAPAFSRLAADPARCRVGGVSAGKRAPARSAIRRCIEVHLRAPAPQVARRGHRAPALPVRAGSLSTPNWWGYRRARSCFLRGSGLVPRSGLVSCIAHLSSDAVDLRVELVPKQSSGRATIRARAGFSTT